MTETHRDSGPVHPQPSPGDDGTTSAPWSRYGWAVAACAATTIIATALLPYLDLANIVLLFLLPVVVVALKCGRGPAVLAAFLSVALFDFFCVPPRLSFAVSDAQYLLTFLVMLAVALVIGQLTAGLRYQARVAAQREERAHALYGFARELSDLLRTEQVVDATVRIVAQTFHAQVAVLLPDDEQRLAVRSRAAVPPGLDLRIAQLAFGESRHPDAQTLADDDLLYLPLPAPMRTRGVLAIKPEHRRMLLAPERKRQLDTFAALAAGALERVHYVEVAQQALIRMESERLRNSLLSALSHDLRTPLAALIGLAESLTLTRPALSGAQLDTAQAITDEARRMSALVNNLLDMARIQSGEVKLLLHWMPFEEVVGSALNAARAALAHHPVEVAVPRDLPLVQLDATLIERVLCNLLENAAKYTPGGTPVTLAAEVSGPVLVVTVRDAGPGIPAGQEETIFEKFTRGARESATPGLGLGLAISRAIVEAHHGRIQAANDPAGGARFTFTLPLGTPPAAPEEAPEEAPTAASAPAPASETHGG